MPDVAEYTYLTLPPDRALRSCIGLVVAGIAARAKIGVGGPEEAVGLLEDRHSKSCPTRYRFFLRDDGLIAEVEEREAAGVRGSGAPAGAAKDATTTWRTVVELVA